MLRLMGNSARFPQGTKVREARHQLGLNLLQVTRRVVENGDGSFLSRIERGEYVPNLSTKLKLVRELEGGGLKFSAIATRDEMQLMRDIAGLVPSR